MKSDRLLITVFAVIVFTALVWLSLWSVEDRQTKTRECEARGGVLVLDAERKGE